MNYYNLGTKTTNNFIVQIKDKLILIDTGLKGTYNKQIKKLNKLGFEVEDINYILITHCHHDHIGCLSEYIENTYAKIIVCPTTLKRLQLGFNYPDYMATSRFTYNSFNFMKFLNIENTFNIIEENDRFIDYTIANKELAKYKIEIKNLKGHTDDSLVLIFNNEAVFVGDVIANFMSKKYLPFIINNKQNLINSWNELIKYEYLIPSHGKPIHSKFLNINSIKDVKLYKLFD